MLLHPYVLPIANSGYKIEVWVMDRLISMSRIVIQAQGRYSQARHSQLVELHLTILQTLIPSCSAELLIPPSIMEFMHEVLYDVDKDVQHRCMGHRLQCPVPPALTRLAPGPMARLSRFLLFARRANPISSGKVTLPLVGVTLQALDISSLLMRALRPS